MLDPAVDNVGFLHAAFQGVDTAFDLGIIPAATTPSWIILRA